MCNTCKYTYCMSKMIQIRHVPNPIHNRLKARAALANMSLSEYLLQHLSQLASQPTTEEMIEQLRKLTPVKTRLSAARAVRAERDRR